LQLWSPIKSNAHQLLNTSAYLYSQALTYLLATMDRQEDPEAVTKGITSLSSMPLETPNHQTGTIENPIQTSEISNPTDSDAKQDSRPNTGNASATELYLWPLIAAFQERQDAGTLTEDDVQLDELYTKWQTAERELSSAGLDAAMSIFPGRELDEEAKARTAEVLVEGGRAAFEAEIRFCRAILERFEGPEEQRVAIFNDIENSWRRFGKG
jgi:hypothetical protein